MERRKDERRMVRLRRGALLLLLTEYDRRFIKLQNPKTPKPQNPRMSNNKLGGKNTFFQRINGISFKASRWHIYHS